MSDWENDPEWLRFVSDVRRGTVEQMRDSAFVLSLIPGKEPDIKLAVELGLAIMLDKPLLGVVAPGTKVTARMLRVFDEIVVADVDIEEGREAVREALERMGL